MTKTPKLTAEQIATAVILDFEGNKDRSPSLIGWRTKGRNHQVLLEEALLPVISPKSIKHASLDEALQRIRQESPEARILTFSEHDLHIVTTYCTDLELVDWFTTHHVNAKLIIQRWVNRQVHVGEIERPKSRSLQHLMPLVGMNYPVAAGTNTVGTTLGRMRTYAEAGRTYFDLARGIKLRWSRVLSHNAKDLEATEALVRAALGIPAPVQANHPNPSPWDVPEWLMDAWRSGQNHVGTRDEELYAKIGELEISMMNHQNPDREEFGLPLSWNWWYFASLLAVAGRRSAMQFLMENDSNFRTEREAHLARARANWDARRASWRTSE